MYIIWVESRGALGNFQQGGWAFVCSSRATGGHASGFQYPFPSVFIQNKNDMMFKYVFQNVPIYVITGYVTGV